VDARDGGVVSDASHAASRYARTFKQVGEGGEKVEAVCRSAGLPVCRSAGLPVCRSAGLRIRGSAGSDEMRASLS
jgi:hypothetical protein